VCPATIPSLGSACSVEGVTCEYGGAWWSVACDSFVSCQGGAWTKYAVTTFVPPCSPEPGPNPSSCPATEADVPQGTCMDTSLSCFYGAGFCTCQEPLGGPVLLVDGGQPAYWGCLPENGCPWPRPRVGAACSFPSSTGCTYAACAYGQDCVNGVWQPMEEGCAVPNQGAN
jgi:hypothetical protein